jgi:hypothetical protein
MKDSSVSSVRGIHKILTTPRVRVRTYEACNLAGCAFDFVEWKEGEVSNRMC